MILFAPKEIDERETRAAITPSTTKILVGKGIEVKVEKGIGKLSGYEDQGYLGDNLLCNVYEFILAIFSSVHYYS